MEWISEFNGIQFRRGLFNFDQTRDFEQSRMKVTGGEGDYDLNGIRSRLQQQTYSFEFTRQLNCYDFQDTLDAIAASAITSGILKKTDGRSIRRATAKVANIKDVSSIDDWQDKRQRLIYQFSAEPYWYNDNATTQTFTSSTGFNVTNRGNARAIKYAVLTITSNVSNPFTFTVTPLGTSPNYYGAFKYGTKKYSSVNTGFAASSLTYAAVTTASLVFDAGNNTVRVNGVDAYTNITRPATQMALFWLEPGVNQIAFNQTVTGNLVFRDCYL